MKPDAQVCPICSKPVEPSQRYPRKVCHECAAKATSRDGRILIFFNDKIWAGFGAKYADNDEQYSRHDCFIDGVKCYADEAYFGGIVIQVAP